MKTVLVVDDNDSIRNCVCGLVRMSGNEAVATSNAYAALTQLQERSFDLIILDNEMPGMQGIELLELIARSGGSLGEASRVVMHTGDRIAGQRALALGAGKFVLKGETIAPLLELIGPDERRRAA